MNIFTQLRSILTILGISIPCFSQADVTRIHSLAGDRATHIEMVKLSTDVAELGYVIGTKDADGKTVITGLTARHDGLKKIAHAKTPRHTPGTFALAAQNGIVVSAHNDTDSGLILYSWDAKSVKVVSSNPKIRRLSSYKSPGVTDYINNIVLTYMYTHSRYHRFAVVAKTKDKHNKIIIFDVHEDTGNIKRRGSQKLIRVSTIDSIDLMRRNVVNLNEPARVVNSVTIEQNLLFLISKHITKDGEVPVAGSQIPVEMTAGRSDLVRIDKNSFFLVYAKKNRQLRFSKYRWTQGPYFESVTTRTIDERPEYGQHYPNFDICDTGGGTNVTVAIRDKDEELAIYDLSLHTNSSIQIRDVNRQSGFVSNGLQTLSCIATPAYVLAAVITSNGHWKIIQFRK